MAAAPADYDADLQRALEFSRLEAELAAAAPAGAEEEADPVLAEALRASRLEAERRASAEKRALLDAAKSGNLGSMRSLLAKRPDHLNAKIDGCWSVLHHYAHAGNTAGARLLLEMRADPDPVGSDGKTPAEVASDSVLSGLLHERAKARRAAESSEQQSLGPQSCRGLGGRPNFAGAFSRKPQFAAHAERVFEELLQREAKMAGEWAVFYHLYNTPALVYEVQAAIASVLFRFGSGFGSLPRLLKRPFLRLPDAAAVVGAFPRWPEKDHSEEFKSVGICCTTSLVAQDPEATPTEFFLNGYGVMTVGIEVLEKLLRDCGAGLDGGDVPRLARRVMELARKHELPQVTGRDPEGHLLQIFVRRGLVDRFAYASLPHGTPDEARDPLSRHMATTGPIGGQARLVVNPSAFMRASSVRMFACSASKEFHLARPAFQRELVGLLSPVLGSTAVRERAVRGIYAGELPSWWRDQGSCSRE